MTFFVVSNMSKEAKSGIFTYHIGPPKAGIYFNKIQCFCFEEQRLKAGETIEMPVLFYIDPDFEKDPKMKDVDSITLAYVLMETEKSPRPEAAASSGTPNSISLRHKQA